MIQKYKDLLEAIGDFLGALSIFILLFAGLFAGYAYNLL